MKASMRILPPALRWNTDWIFKSPTQFNLGIDYWEMLFPVSKENERRSKEKNSMERREA